MSLKAKTLKLEHQGHLSLPNLRLASHQRQRLSSHQHERLISLPNSRLTSRQIQRLSSHQNQDS